MRAMRWLRGALALAVICAWSAQAQDDDLGPGDEAERPHFRERLRNALNFTDEQKEQLRTVRQHLRVELEYIRGAVSDGEMTPEEAREQYGQAVRIHRAGRDTILTDEQKALLERARRYLEEERLAAPTEEPQLRRPHERLIAALELTEGQVAQWRRLLRRVRAVHQEMHDDGEVSERDDFLRMREAFAKAFDDLLSPEQLVKLDEIRDNWQARRAEGREIQAADFGLYEEEELPSLVEEESWGRVKEMEQDDEFSE